MTVVKFMMIGSWMHVYYTK